MVPCWPGQWQGASPLFQLCVHRAPNSNLGGPATPVSLNRGSIQEIPETS